MTDSTEVRLAGSDQIRPPAAIVAADARYVAAAITWMPHGACQNEDPELFFPIAANGPALSQISAAKVVCRRCVVAATCLAYALETGQAGIWGGTTWDERRALPRPHRGAARRIASSPRD
jgi:WhiB family transcriptional regulator, redox-sensing transcriptional regulator